MRPFRYIFDSNLILLRSVLREYMAGRPGPLAATALTAMNVVVRMIPIQKSTPHFTKRSFFRVDQARSLGGGLQLAEGFFQYVSLVCIQPSDY